MATFVFCYLSFFFLRSESLLKLLIIDLRLETLAKSGDFSFMSGELLRVGSSDAVLVAACTIDLRESVDANDLLCLDQMECFSPTAFSLLLFLISQKKLNKIKEISRVRLTRKNRSRRRLWLFREL